MKKSENVLLWIGLTLTMLIMAWMLAGCNPTKKAFDRVQRTENRTALAEICAEKFPVKDSVIEKVETIFDTIYVGTDPVFDTVVYKDTVRITKTLPAKVITKTVEKTKEVLRENTAKIVGLEGRLSAAQTALAKAADDLRSQTAKANHYRKQRNKAYLWWLILAAAVGGWFYLRKKFMFTKLDKNQLA